MKHIKKTLKAISYKLKAGTRGQAMLLTTVMMSGVILSVSAIAGLLMLYQVRQATDAVDSSMAFYAADAGVEQTLYCYFTGFDIQSDVDIAADGCNQELTLTNGASFETRFILDKPEVNMFTIRSIGSINDAERALETIFSIKTPQASPP